jgi:asparagine synthetase B (glutamine-hydrolysing)
VRGETLAHADVVVAADLMVRLSGAVRAIAGDAAACVLSGGLDSAMLVAILARSKTLTAAYTLAADFDDDAELTRAFDTAAHFGVAHHRVVTLREQDLPGRFVDAVRANGVPVVNGKAVATFVLLEQLRAHGEQRFLSGLGADELLDGDLYGQESWRAALDRDRALAAQLETPPGAPPAPLTAAEIFATLTLPPTLHAARHLGLQAGLPYCHDLVTRWAAEQPRAIFQRGELGKWPLRAAAKGLVQEKLRLLPKTPRLAPPGGGCAASREAWNDLLASLLTRSRLGVLRAPAIDAARVTALRDEHAALHDADGRRASVDRVLLGLASRVILAEARGAHA